VAKRVGGCHGSRFEITPGEQPGGCMHLLEDYVLSARD
jgi:hypothetical protein